MLEEHRWGLAIPVSQIACEGPSKTHLAWGAWGGPVEKLSGSSPVWLGLQPSEATPLVS
jgi:hypothetical protein